MGKIFAFGLLLIGVAIGLGLDFSRASKAHPAGAYSLSDHVAFRAGEVKAVLPIPRGKADILPPAPDGWTRHAAVYEDTVRATGMETPEDEIAAGKTLEKVIYDAVPGYKRYYQTYETDGQIVVIDTTFVPVTEETQKGRAAMGVLFRRLAGGADAWATIGGVDLSRIERPKLGKARTYLGQIEGIAFISVASNADDATTRQVLSGVDFAALRGMVDATKAAGTAPDAKPTVGIGASDGCVRNGAGKFCSVSN